MDEALAAPVEQGDFAPAMATGIIAVGASAEGVAFVPSLLAAVAAAFWLALTVWALRAGATPAGLDDHLRRFGFVAASGVLISLPMLELSAPVRAALGLLAAAAWVALVVRASPPLAASRASELVATARGGWLLPVVATESLAIVSARFGGTGAAIGVALLVGGLVLYGAVAGLLTARLLTGGAGLAAITPDWWVVPGALAISTLAAARLDVTLAGDRIEPTVHGAVLALWIAGTMLIPPVLAADALRTLRYGSRYEPERWAFVFPLGMYAVATHAVGLRLREPALVTASTVFFWAALVAWVLTLAGAVACALRGGVSPPRGRSPRPRPTRPAGSRPPRGMPPRWRDRAGRP